MNTITLADIKRGGMLALDLALKNGPAFLMKRNRTAAVVLTQAEYERLQSASNAAHATPTVSALDLFLTPPPAAAGGLSKTALRRRAQEARDEWGSR